MKDWLDEVHWSVDGLVPAIAQGHGTGRVLMVAWMNREVLTLITSENRAICWSCSRGKLQYKSKESGHVQKLHRLRLDRDADMVTLTVEQVGGITRHTGRESCSYHVLENGVWRIINPVLKDPDAIYEHAGHYHD